MTFDELFMFALVAWVAFTLGRHFGHEDGIEEGRRLWAPKGPR